MSTNIQLSGFKEFRDKLSNLPKVLKEEIGGELYDASLSWAQRAKDDAPVDQGALKREIVASLTGELQAQVVCNVEYAPYIEWGTKTKVSIPSDVADYAAQFRGGNDNSGKAKQMIYEWMKRVGIAKEFQWIVFITIIVKGITPHPFFFIQRPETERELIAGIGKILNTEH